MDSVALALQFNSNIVGPALVSGFTSAGLYALLAVALVLSYRVTRTVAFIHGGVPLLGAVRFSGLTPPRFGTETHPELPKFLGLAMVVALGALIAGVYGLAVTGKRMAGWPRVALTTVSLAGTPVPRARAPLRRDPGPGPAAAESVRHEVVPPLRPVRVDAPVDDPGHRGRHRRRPLRRPEGDAHRDLHPGHRRQRRGQPPRRRADQPGRHRCGRPVGGHR